MPCARCGEPAVRTLCARCEALADAETETPKAKRRKPQRDNTPYDFRRGLESVPDAYFLALLEGAGLPCPRSEYVFHEGRNWRFDYCWPDQLVALEVEGGVFKGGRHTRGAGYAADLEKYNTATLDGWKLIRVTPNGLSSYRTMQMLRVLLGGT